MASSHDQGMAATIRIDPNESGDQMCSSMDISCLKDDVYESMKSNFLATGKGRRTTLPAARSDNRLLIQLLLLREESGATFQVVHTWMQKLHPQLLVNPTTLSRDIKGVWKKFQSLNSNGQSQKAFLEQNYDPNFVSSALSRVGLDKPILLAPVTDFTCEQKEVSNDIIVSLEHFRVRQKLGFDFTSKWYSRLTKVVTGDYRHFKRQLKKRLKIYRDVSKGKSKLPKKYNDFMSSPFIIEAKSPREKNVGLTSATASAILVKRHTSTSSTQTTVKKFRSVECSTSDTEEAIEIKELKVLNKVLIEEMATLKTARLYHENCQECLNKDVVIDNQRREIAEQKRLLDEIEIEVKDFQKDMLN